MSISIDLSPRPSLAQAIDLENDHIGHFRTWALRLRPFDPGLSRLLDLQVEEMDDHRRMLLDLWENPTGHRGHLSRPLLHQDPPDAKHFFVLDTRSANGILEHARTLKEKALHYYQHCALGQPEASTLGGVFRTLQTSKDVHLQILREAQAGFASRHP